MTLTGIMDAIIMGFVDFLDSVILWFSVFFGVSMDFSFFIVFLLVFGVCLFVMYLIDRWEDSRDW